MVMTALVVEDDTMMMNSLERSLESMGYNVVLQNYLDNQSAPEQLFDLAVVDGLGGSGIPFLKDVNAERKFLYTGDYEMVKKAKSAGLEVHMKPDSMEEILEVGK